MTFTLNELVDNQVMQSKGQFFRNREIVQATGASRQHVSQRLKFLWDEGIIEKSGNEWYVADQAKLVTLMLRKSRALELNNSKLLNAPANKLALAVEALQLLNSSRSEWDAAAMRLERALLQETDTAIETLRNFKKLLKDPAKSNQQIYMHMVNSKGYATELQNVFVALVKSVLGESLDYEEIITDMHSVAQERYENA